MDGIPTSTINKNIVFQPKTVADWLQRVPGGSGVREMRYGYFGPGSGLLQKDITSSPASTAFQSTNFFVNTFGAKVWDSLNSQTRFFNLMRKVAWGPTTGYRIRSGRNTSTQPVTEVAALPTIQSPTLKTIYIQPKFIVSSMGVSSLAQFLGTLEGGIGDALAVAQETTMIDHTKKLNQMLLASATQRIVSAGTAGGSAATGIDNAWVNVGDVYAGTSLGTTNVATVSSVSTANTTDFSYTGNANFTANEIIWVTKRGGFSSIDDIIEYNNRTVNGTALGSTNSPQYGTMGDGAGANGTTSRVKNDWNAGNVLDNSGTLRHLSTGLIDQAIDTVRKYGGEPDLIVTGVEQVTRLGTILQANQHFIGEGTFQVKMGGEGTLVGYPTGFQVATYKEIPIFHDFDIADSYQLQANGNALRGGNMYVLDTRFLEVPVLFTTQYMESRDYLQNNMLGIKAIYLTSAEFRALDFRKQAKIMDLSDGINLT